MKFRHIATAALLAGASLSISSSAFAATDSACATLVGTAGTTAPQGFQVRNGEPVDLVGNGKTVHGTLLVFGDNGLFRAYWQPENSAEKFVLANAGVDTIRLVSTPPQGSPAQAGQPGTTLAPQRVLSCPAL